MSSKYLNARHALILSDTYENVGSQWALRVVWIQCSCSVCRASSNCTAYVQTRNVFKKDNASVLPSVQFVKGQRILYRGKFSNCSDLDEIGLKLLHNLY